MHDACVCERHTLHSSGQIYVGTLRIVGIEITMLVKLRWRHEWDEWEYGSSSFEQPVDVERPTSPIQCDTGIQEVA